MYNSQLKRLNSSILSESEPKQPYIAFEPMVLKRKRMKKIGRGVWLKLGNRLPLLRIIDGSKALFSAELGRLDGSDAVWIRERLSEPRSSSCREEGVELEVRLAVLPAERIEAGSIVRFGWSVSSGMLVMMDGRCVGTASLISYEKGFALEITEWRS